MVKTRLMVDRERSLTIRQCAAEIYHDEGLRGFKRGIAVRTTGVTLITCVLFVSYEKTKVAVEHLLYGQERAERSGTQARS